MWFMLLQPFQRELNERRLVWLADIIAVTDGCQWSVFQLLWSFLERYLVGHTAFSVPIVALRRYAALWVA